MTRRNLAIDFACNDPDSGVFAGRAVMAEFLATSLECDDWESGYKFSDEGGFIRLHRRKYRYEKSREWVGNWCWNRYWFEREVGLSLIRNLAKSGRWTCTGGPVRICNYWERIAKK